MTVTQTRMAGGLDAFALQSLRARLLGELILPGEEEYDAARRTKMLHIDRYPALIVRAAGAGDVIRAVEFARARELPLAVRSGGHSLPGHSSVDGGIVVDLSHMNALSIDPERRTAWTQPGVTSRDLFTASEPYGLALSTGDTGSVGIGGLTLGGGIGWLVRKHGLTIDNLLSAEVVTADGRIVVASEDEHPDLFWALRGGGGNFGIVTGFEFRLHLDAMILGGMIMFPLTAEVLRGWAEYAPYAPEGLTTISVVMKAPPAPFVPEEVVGQTVFAILLSYAGDTEEGQRAIQPLRSLGVPLVEMIAPMPYSAMFNFTAESEAPEAPSVRSGYMRELGDDAIAAIIEHTERYPAPPMSIIQLRGLGGAMANVPSDATAFAHRDMPLFLAIVSLDEDGGGDWTEALWSKLQPYTSGVYVGFLGDEGEERIREAYPPETYARLAEVKRRYDPTNLFRLNQNIKPAS